MKILFLLLLCPVLSWSQDCKVDGISDSPQELDCQMKVQGKKEKLALSCDGGVYKIEWLGEVSAVTVAYHEEVESGDSPLVFLTETYRFSVTGKVARLSSKKGSARGRCL